MRFLALLVGLVAFIPAALCIAVTVAVAAAPAALAYLFCWICYGCLTTWDSPERPQ